MATPKYLRHIAVHTDALPGALGTAEVHHIPNLLERLFTPTPSEGVAKVNVCFSTSNSKPIIELALDIAIVEWRFDADRFQRLSADEQSRYYLQQVRDALAFAGKLYGWDLARLDASCARIKKDGFRAEWLWPAKPKPNPRRQSSAQVFIAMATATRAWVVFFDRSGVETARVLLTNLGPGGNSGVLESVLGDFSWANGETVRVRHANRRDYWLVMSQGSVEFVFPLAASDDPHGLYQLGRLYWEGRFVPIDRHQALQLMRRSAALGYKHAQRFVETNGQWVKH